VHWVIFDGCRNKAQELAVYLGCGVSKKVDCQLVKIGVRCETKPIDLGYCQDDECIALDKDSN
jgi:hypothetical protein